MTARSIRAEITISDATHTKRLDFGIYQASPHKWRAANWKGHFASDFTKETNARKFLADKLRDWADHIERNAFPKDDAPGRREVGT